MTRLFALSVLALASLIAAAGSASAGSAEQASILAGCLKSLNWSDAACQCFADKAGELTDGQQGFLAATMNEDKASVGQFAMSLSQAEILAATMFPIQAGPACQ